jgi:hypothetical protein
LSSTTKMSIAITSPRQLGIPLYHSHMTGG